jgi:Protein of unknown function (DUF2948)
MTDARFQDAAERPLYLGAEDARDLLVMSALLQDAILAATDMTWDRQRRRLAILLNRFRWEDRDAARAERRAVERVRSVLVVRDVRAIRSWGIDRKDASAVLSVLALGWVPGEDGTGLVNITMAGNAALSVDVEALDVTLRDVTRPYAAPSGRAPQHPGD